MKADCLAKVIWPRRRKAFVGEPGWQLLLTLCCLLPFALIAPAQTTVKTTRALSPARSARVTTSATAPSLRNSGEPEPALAPPDAALVRELLNASRTQFPVGKRINIISAHLLGKPYLINPLIGSLDQPEVLVTRMDGFDCVTFIETVLALAYARNETEFVRRLRELRYRDGLVQYQNRLHYTTDWSQYHVRRGFLQDLTVGDNTLVREKPLFLLKQLPAKVAHFRFYPKYKLASVTGLLHEGDLIYFVSGRKGLDISHVGLIIRDGDRLLLRHATRHRRQVVEQELEDFCRRTPMSGFIINRPKE